MHSTPPHHRISSQPSRIGRDAIFLLLIAGLIENSGCAAWPLGAKRGGGSSPGATADDNPFLPLRPDAGAPLAASSNPVQLPPVAELSVLHLRVPRAQRGQVEKVWALLREDVVDSDTVQHLRRNGLRVGVGHATEWDAVKAVLDAAPDCGVHEAAPVRLPEGFPLDLQLSAEPRDQTIFCVERDGILSGADLAASRNALRVVYGPEPRDAGRARLSVVPCTIQEQTGLRWVRTAEGVAQTPRYGGRIYTSAAFSTALGPGEFLVIATGSDADVPGIIGRAMLTDDGPDGEFFTYLFLRPALIDVRKQ